MTRRLGEVLSGDINHLSLARKYSDDTTNISMLPARPTSPGLTTRRANNGLGCWIASTVARKEW